jgi:hypothetical protein
MKLTYETGIATFIQFIALSFLNIANGVNSVVTTCRHESTDCVGNILVSIIFFMLVVGWFGAVWVLGYYAQERRSYRLALALIGAEGLIALIALFNAKHNTDYLSLATSLIDLVLALWIVLLAFRLMRSRGKRITAKHRPRRRIRKT